MNILSVSELTSNIKGVLEPQFRNLQVKGEISNFKLQSSGHLYFSLKDTNSQISCALFKGNAAKLNRMPKEGDQVIAKGEISLYVPRGQYQLIVRELEFLGVGELLLQLHLLKEKLEKRGWFDPLKKKKLPHLPKRIGVVTSPTGAVIRDILNVLTRRFSGFQVLLNPVKVQGEGAALEIAKAISDFNKHELADVLIVGRGGGSIEDLWAFNEEVVAKAIFESKIPVISAVGHETDFTIADWASDVRAPTPSAAAEIAVKEKAALQKFLSQTKFFVEKRALQVIEQYRKNLINLEKHPLFSSPYTLLAEPIQKLDMIQQDFEQSMNLGLERKRQKLETLEQRLKLLDPSSKIQELKKQIPAYQSKLEKALLQALQLKKQALLRLYEHLLSINPKNLLKKGYALLFKEKDQSLILSAKSLTPKEKLTAHLFDGHLKLHLEEILPYD